MVTEEIINKIIDQLEAKEVYQAKLQSLIEQQPAIISYFESEGFDILSNEEKDLLWYLTLVVYESYVAHHETNPVLRLKKIEKAEEENYTMMKQDHLRFSEIADLFFEGYEEEDLLALIEDTVIPDEGDFPSPVGRKVIFTTMKTIIDVLGSST